LVERLRLDEFPNRLRLGEIDAAVQKRPHSEFAGLGESRASGQSQLHDMAQDHRRAMGGDFDDVIGSVGMRLGEVRDHYFVNALLGIVWSGRPRPLVLFPGRNWRARVRVGLRAGEGARSTGLDQLSEHYSAGRKIVLQAQHGTGNTARLRSGEADDAHPAAAWRSTDGDDGIVKVHKEIVAAEPRGALPTQRCADLSKLYRLARLLYIHAAFARSSYVRYR
jgi:hypothetical protein